MKQHSVQDSYCTSFLPSNTFFFFDNNYEDSLTKDARFSSELWKHFKDSSSHNSGIFHKDEMQNEDTKLDDSLTEAITMMWKVAVDIFLFDSTMLSLGDNHLLLRSKACATL